MQKGKELAKKTRYGILIDADYIIVNDETRVRLLMKGKTIYYLYDRHEPYFYLDAPGHDIAKLMKASVIHRGGKITPAKIEEVEREVEGKRRKILKVYAKHPPEVPDLRTAFKDLRAFEYNIPFGRRYMIDRQLAPLSKLKYERQGKRLLKVLKIEDCAPKFRMMSFDIETYNPLGAPRPEKDPSIMISYASGQSLEKAHVLTYKEIKGAQYSRNCKNEKGMIEEFCKAVEKEDAEILVGYNSTQFDLPYLQKRAQKTGARLALGRDGTAFTIRRRGIRDVAKIKGRVYIDLLPLLRFLSFIAAVKLNQFSLEAAYEGIIGKKSEWKQKMQRLDIWQMWDDEKKLFDLAEYSRFDAHATWEIAKYVLPLELEMAKLTNISPTDVAGATSSQLVESLLMFEASARGAVVPNKPNEKEVEARTMNPIQGAFVKTPPPGIYENIMVFDFRGLYPSIIISHNIDPFTLNPKHLKESECNISPTGAKFAKEPQGIIPQVLEKVITSRGKLKDELKKLKPETDEYRSMFARQQSLKILANSYYGYLAYARSRYYSRECAESVTAWGRHFITKTIEDAKNAGFEVIYGDTDSVMMLLGSRKYEDAIAWMKKVNSTLPGTMELELEGYFPRGVFVSKKLEAGGKVGTGAKKKYALMDKDGRVKIRGFELVRRDWSVIARETQKKVLEAILKDGSKDKAVDIVRKVVDEIKGGKMPIEKMVIETQLVKPLDKYEVRSPELSAALKANKKGKGEKLGQGSVVRYVITRSSTGDGGMESNSKGTAQRTKNAKSSVSDKAELLEYAKDYDADYYISHQIIPTVLKILKELGVEEEDLKRAGKQKGLESFF